MRNLDKNIINLLLAAGMLSLLGCSGVPGFKIVSNTINDPQRESTREHILGYQPVVEHAPSFENTPDNAITSITPELIRDQRLNQPTEIPQEVKGLFGTAPVYTIGAGDVVGIIVYDHPELLPNSGAVISQTSDPTGISVAQGFLVGSTGEVSFPYAGRVRLNGLTEIEASDLITKRISSYIKDPQVTVRITSFRSRRAYVEGEVRTPGLQIFTDVPMTLAEAISRAGGISATGDRSAVTLTRSNKTILINLQLLQERGADAGQIPLFNGDVVNIRSRDENKVYVMGEVMRPSALLMRNGRLTLNEALGDAGGPNLATANPGQIYVVRNESDNKTSVFHLNAKSPIALALADRFALQPKDVVYIDQVPLVQWSRIVNLILPAASVVGTGTNAIK